MTDAEPGSVSEGMGVSVSDRAPTRVDSVYVHAPFCARRCVYCDFAVSVRRSGDLEAWISALEAELDHLRHERLFELGRPLTTLYVGGGTPSLLGAEAMSRLGEVLGSDRLAHPDLEWTAEANPESFTDEVARRWTAAGVNRLSVGLQTFNEDALRWMGRLHGADGPTRAISRARSAGIENISVDLIFGLPARLGRSWEDDLRRVVDLDVPHVSLYGLTVEPATALGRAVAEDREAPVDEEQYRDEFLMAAAVLTDGGYEHYEVSNFARAGARSRHNSAYWDGTPYVGLGNGAHSYAPPLRRWNERDWNRYAAAAASGSGPESEREVLDAEALELESVWLGLRTRDGLARPPLATDRGRLVSHWIEQGLAEAFGSRVRLTVEGWLLLDRLAVEYAAADAG